MPDYNAAVAAGIQPSQGLDFGRTLSTVADWQRAQAATALSQLQALQVQRKYNGVLATQQALAHGGSPSQAFQAGVTAGADPQDITNALAAASTAQFMGANGGYNPQAAEARANIGHIGAETSLTQAQIPGALAKSQSDIMNGAAQLANQYRADPTQENWDAMRAYTKKYQGEAAAKQLDGITNPSDRMARAVGHTGGGLTAEQNKPQAVSPESNFAVPTDIMAGRGVMGQGPQAAPQGAPQVAGAPAGAPNTPLSVKAQGLAAERSDKAYAGIQAQAAQYERDTKPYLDLSRSILNNPAMYSGVGGNLVLDWNRVKAAVGDQQAAMLQEGLQKVTATSVLGQINQQRDQLMEAGGSSGRIFAQQVGLVEKAAPQLATTLGGNRFLVEVSSRMGDLNTQVRDMAANYKQQHGILDAGFDKQVSDYMKSHPIFTKEELSKPELLGVPTAPPGLRDTQSRKAWGSGMGLNPGDAFRVNGQYKYWGGAPQQ